MNVGHEVEIDSCSICDSMLLYDQIQISKSASSSACQRTCAEWLGACSIAAVLETHCPSNYVIMMDSEGVIGVALDRKAPSSFSRLSDLLPADRPMCRGQDLPAITQQLGSVDWVRVPQMASASLFKLQWISEGSAVPSCRSLSAQVHCHRFSSSAASLTCRAAAATQYAYQAPSSITAATELSALSALSSVVPDTYLSRSLHELASPKAATVSSAVLYGILSSPGSERESEVRSDRT